MSVLHCYSGFLWSCREKKRLKVLLFFSCLWGHVFWSYGPETCWGHDRFERILRYWAYGPETCWEELLEKPWGEVSLWVEGFNKARRNELEVGTDVTPDEMMMAWKGKKGNGGIPHLSFIERKPIPLGTELKAVCEGTFGVAVFLEIQTGKITMQRKNGVESIKPQLPAL